MFAFLALAAAGARASAQDSRPALAGPPEGAKRHLEDASTYRVEWRTPAAWGPDTEIEIDSGRYDCCYEREPALEWYRIRRAEGRFELLHFETGGGNDSAEAGRVRVEHAAIGATEHAAILRDLSWICAARLARLERQDFGWSQTGCRLWSYARISDGSGACWEDAWAGGTGSFDEIHYAKSRACVARVEEAFSRARFEPFEPTVEERRRILDSVSRSTYAGRPWEAFGGAEPLTELYRRLVRALGGEPETCLPPRREEVEFRAGNRMFDVRDHVTILDASGNEVPTNWWICRMHLRSFDCGTVRLEPGEYVAVLDAPAYEPRRYPLAVRRGERATIEIELVTCETRR